MSEEQVPFHVGNQPRDNQQVLMGLFDTSALLETVENTLRGLRFNRQSGKWEPRLIGYQRNPDGSFPVDKNNEPFPVFAQPLVNETGVSRIMSFMETHTNHIFQASMFESDEVRKMAIEGAYWICDQAYINRQEWGLEVSDMETVCEIVDHAFFAILKQGWGGGMRDLLQKTTNVNEIRQGRDPDEPRGGIKGFFGR